MFAKTVGGICGTFSSIQLFYCGKSSGKVCMQFEKKDVGYCGKLFGVRGSALLAEREGGNKKGSILENGGEHMSTSSLSPCERSE